MEIYTKPKNLNGAELRQELQNAGVKIDAGILAVILNGDTLLLDIDAADREKAARVVELHNGSTIPYEVTVADKLSMVGLDINELKTALGLETQK